MTFGDNATRHEKPASGNAPSWPSLLEYLDTTLRGCGQVIFMDNPLTGALNLVAMFWGAFAGGTTYAAAIGSAIGALVATATACALPVDRASLRMGLYGFNGMLVGAGIATFVTGTGLMWVMLIFAAAISTVVTLAVEGILKVWKTPGLTFPFVLTTWLFLASAYRFSGIGASGLPTAALASAPVTAGGIFGPAEFLQASLASVSQVFFVDNAISGLIFLVALAVHSRWCASLAAVGALLSVTIALLFGADRQTILQGLWGYSAVLTAPAVGCIFLRPTRFSLTYSVAATIFTVFLQSAISALAQTAGLPALTFPFVLATWLFLLAQHAFEPDVAA
ncbi:MAG: urea transporter [Bryobacterales bacterium]|nr:urea transporter [Bryobacterales bacterium]